MKTLTDLSREAQTKLDELAWGVPNPEGIAYFKDMARQMRAVPPVYASCKIIEMTAWANILYSARKHRSYPDGARGVRQFLLMSLTVMRDIDCRYQESLAA